MSLLQEIEQHGLADCEFNRNLLTDNQKAFIKAVKDSAGIPEMASIEFLLTESAGKFLKSPYCDYYNSLADSYDIWQLAINFERSRCYSICESIGTEADGHYCADEIGVNHG